MKRISILMSILVGLLLIAPLLAILFLANTLVGTPFPPYSLFNFASRLLPGPVITFGIDSIVGIVRGLNLGPTDTTAKLAERIMAIGMMAVGGILLSVIYFAIVPRFVKRAETVYRDSQMVGRVFGLLAALPIILIVLAYDTSSPLPSVVVAIFLAVVFFMWGEIHGIVYSRLAEPLSPVAAEAVDPGKLDYVPPMMRTEAPVAASNIPTAASVAVLNRRQFLIQLGGTAAVITVAGAGLSAWLNASRAASELAEIVDNDPSNATFMRSDEANLTKPAPGTRLEYTPLDRHYRIDINSDSGPAIAEADYELEISGMVETPLKLKLADIRNNYEKQSQYITMSCISNPLGGDLISTTKWTGISMQDLLKTAKPAPGARYLKISAADGFYETVALDVINNDPKVMLAYEWDDQPLTQIHGFPLRIHIPNRYGMKQPKWITSMEFVGDWEPGFWVDRGWDKEALVRATSVIDTVATKDIITDGDKKLVPVGGIAWAGTRGISKVEVSVDGGTWNEAQLRKPLSEKAWVLWRYDWPYQEGTHTFSVRCYETDGTMQIVDEAGVHPSGATGIISKRASL
ncbi:MAG: molybdopterin-dependent oxidoreductase [Anaerolineae bacterium]|nr:molybdopterin-dependent oxidoreductase [Anaerolineae bacterium]